MVIFCAVAVYAPLVGGSQDERAKKRGLETLTEVMDIIQKHSIAPQTPKQVAYASIQGMLQTLDPHSSFMDELEFRNMRDDQKGAYFGIGAIIQGQPDGAVAIVNTIAGGPAEKAGLRAGDSFREIDGKTTEGQNSNQVMRRLRGEKGTTVVLTVQRPGAEQLINLSIVRAEIPNNSVYYSFMLTDEIGFIKIRDFGEATSDDFGKAIASLKKKGLKALILDLRDNPGGSLDAAIGISKQLLGPNELILTQKGREGRDPVFFRTDSDDRLFANSFPLAVLINRRSASASEIVAGAIQDHDRGLLVGETSWGKGLVQVVVPINRTRGLGLTIARYHTPSGRCIQRDYQHGLDDYYILDSEDPDPAAAEGPEYRTDLGRIVYGGGGIRPDYLVARKEHVIAYRLRNVMGAYFKFAVAEKDRLDSKLGQAADGATMARFKEWLGGQNINISDEDWKAAEKDINANLTIEIQSLLFGSEAGFKYESLATDAQVQKAIEMMPEAESLYKKRLEKKGR
jgi:carboxyl-terminal processing protease